MNQAIRLTNKTAIALRRNAQQVRAAHVAAVVLLSAVLAVCAVLLGIYVWLPAVPLTVLLAVLLDSAIMLHARSRYLSLLAQAICTEAAAQEIRAGHSEKNRRARAISDLMSAKADMQRAQSGEKKTAAPDAKPFFEKESAQEAGFNNEMDSEPENKSEDRSTETDQPLPAAPHRRRRQKSLQLIRGEQVK